jgi:hypothetical protein
MSARSTAACLCAVAACFVGTGCPSQTPPSMPEPSQSGDGTGPTPTPEPAPPSQATPEPAADPAASAVAQAQEACGSGRAAVERGEWDAALPDLEHGVQLLEPLALELTMESGGGLLAACLGDMGRAREVVASDVPLEGPEVFYGRSLALRADEMVAERLGGWLEENGGEECTLGEVRRTESVSRVLPGWEEVAEAVADELASEAEDRTQPPFASEAEALAFLFGQVPGPPERPVVTTVGDGRWDRSFFLVPRADGTVLAAHALAAHVRGICVDGSAAWIATEVPIHVVAYRSGGDTAFRNRRGGSCEPDDDLSSYEANIEWPADDREAVADDEDCVRGCMWFSHTVTHWFADPESGRTVTIEAEVEGLDPVGDGQPYRYVQVERLDGRLVLYGCGTRMEFEP